MKKAWIIAGGVGLIGITAVAIAVPVAITSANQAKELEANRKIIEKVELTTDWQDDYVGMIVESIGTMPPPEEGSDIQAWINSKSDNWVKWINPINKANEIDKTAIAKIDSVTAVIDEEAKKMGLEFKITWKEGLEIPENLKNGYNINFNATEENSYLPWKVSVADSVTKMQAIIDAGATDGFYASADKISEELNASKNQKTIIELVDTSKDASSVRKATIVAMVMPTNPETGDVMVMPIIIYSMEDATRIAYTPIPSETDPPIVLTTKITPTPTPEIK